jgi:hypothetical protein
MPCRSTRCGHLGHAQLHHWNQAVAARNRHRAAHLRFKLDHGGVAGFFHPPGMGEIDDVTSVGAVERRLGKPPGHFRYRQRTEKVVTSVEDISVVGIRVDGNDLIGRDMQAVSVLLDRKQVRRNSRVRLLHFAFAVLGVGVMEVLTAFAALTVP